MILAIDPGPTESASVLWSKNRIASADIMANEGMLGMLIAMRNNTLVTHLFIEKIASYGCAVGATTFETVYWTGRFAQAFGVDRTERIERLKIKMHLCHDSRAKDANIRRALIDRLGPPGTKKAPGQTYGIRSHCWSALALAVYAHDHLSKGVAA